MTWVIAPLPFEKNALEPVISARTVDLHYEKHHKGYLAKLIALTQGKPEAGKTLTELIATASGPIFNNAAQVWNHSFYWNSLSPSGGGEPNGKLRERIDESFGSFSAFRQRFAEAAIQEFGSGWAWLTQESSGRLRVCSSDDAENPLRNQLTPLLTIDVWEHAYYLDYQNERPRYVEGWLASLANWEFAAANLELGLGWETRNAGEGDAEADARYREGIRRFAKAGRVEEAARRAAREEG
jgi:Fe-Mn family superoxide dismutase